MSVRSIVEGVPSRVGVAPAGLERYLGAALPWAYAHGYKMPPLRGYSDFLSSSDLRSSSDFLGSRMECDSCVLLLWRLLVVRPCWPRLLLRLVILGGFMPTRRTSSMLACRTSRRRSGLMAGLFIPSITGVFTRVISKISACRTGMLGWVGAGCSAIRGSGRCVRASGRLVVRREFVSPLRGSAGLSHAIRGFRCPTTAPRRCPPTAIHRSPLRGCCSTVATMRLLSELSGYLRVSVTGWTSSGLVKAMGASAARFLLWISAVAVTRYLPGAIFENLNWPLSSVTV